MGQREPDPAIDHINRQIPPEPHTAMYVWHKYWSRKTWNVVREFIRTYSQAGQLVFDPFAGAGREKRTCVDPSRSRRLGASLFPF